MTCRVIDMSLSGAPPIRRGKTTGHR